MNLFLWFSLCLLLIEAHHWRLNTEVNLSSTLIIFKELLELFRQKTYSYYDEPRNLDKQSI